MEWVSLNFSTFGGSCVYSSTLRHLFEQVQCMCWFKVYRVINSFLLFCTYSFKSFVGKACACFSMFGGVGGIPSSRSNTLNQLLNLFLFGRGG